MNSVLNDYRCLVLNAYFRCIAVATTRKAIENLTSINKRTGKIGYTALDFSEEHGFIPVTWDDWIKLDVREGDDAIRTAHGQIRAPRVIIAINYAKIPKKKRKPTTQNLLKQYDYKCYWTGKKLAKGRASREHVQPVSHGGKSDWENLAPADRDINSLRGNMSIKDFEKKHGFKPQYPLRAPKEVPVGDTIENVLNIPEWEQFLRKFRN